MTILLAVSALLVAPSPQVAMRTVLDPDRVDVAEAIACGIDAPSYNGFALSLEGDTGIAAKRHWTALPSTNPFMTEYALPAPITVAGHYSTRRIAFTATAILAVLDLADPGIIARAEHIANATGSALIDATTTFHKFLGEHVIADVTEPATADQSIGAHTVVARTVSNATTHPGKTFYGCSYSVEPIGKDGKPL